MRMLCGHTPLPGLDPRPTQAQTTGPRQAELVICEQTIDITYVRMRRGFLYLVAILDWFSRSDAQLGTLQHARRQLLPSSTGVSADPYRPRDLQHRPGG